MLLKMYSEAFQLVETECLILTSKRIKHASSNASQKDVKPSNKLGCVVTMVVDSILPHAESGPNDHRKDAPRLQVINQKLLRTIMDGRTVPIMIKTLYPDQLGFWYVLRIFDTRKIVRFVVRILGPFFGLVRIELRKRNDQKIRNTTNKPFFVIFPQSVPLRT